MFFKTSTTSKFASFHPCQSPSKTHPKTTALVFVFPGTAAISDDDLLLSPAARRAEAPEEVLRQPLQPLHDQRHTAVAVVLLRRGSGATSGDVEEPWGSDLDGF